VDNHVFLCCVLGAIYLSLTRISNLSVWTKAYEVTKSRLIVVLVLVNTVTGDRTDERGD